MSKTHQSSETVTIGELARCCATTLRAIRWYTEQGLLGPSGTKGNCALYPAGAVAVVRRIQALQQAGLTLSEIHSLFALIASNTTKGKHLTSALRASVHKQLTAIREREQELTRIRKLFEILMEQTDGCDTCNARGPKHDCKGCGNLEALKTLGSAS